MHVVPDEDTGYCVYLHRRSDNKDIIYVGEGRLARAKSFRINSGRNKEYGELVRTTDVYCEIYKDGLTKQQAEELEEYLIIQLKTEGHPITNKSKKSTSGLAYHREEFEDLFYTDPKSPSGLRWKTDRYSQGNKGTLLARKDTVAGSKGKALGYWCYINKACHRIVVALELGICPAGMTVDHLDGNKDNNCITNLEIVSAGENSRRSHLLRKDYPRGEDVCSSKITEKQLLEIYELFRQGRNNDFVAEKYDLHSRYVSLIRHGKRWGHVYEKVGEKFPPSFTEEKVPIESILKAYDLIQTTTLMNKEIAELTNIEVSNISRLRHGKAWKRVIDLYRKETDAN